MAKNKLTLFIFIALITGIAVGYLYNVNSIGTLNRQISTVDLQIKDTDSQLAILKDTLSVPYKQLQQKRAGNVKTKKSVEATRESKLELFTVMSTIFLKLIKMIVAPLVLSTLIVGVAKVGNISAVGRIGGKTLLWFISASLISLLLGMLLVNKFEPGTTMHLPLPDTRLDAGVGKTGLSLPDFVGHIFPESLIGSMANNQILQIVVFALFFGTATAAIGEKGEVIIKAMDAIAHVILKITSYVMQIAPFAVFGAIAVVVAKQGLGILSTYAIFIGEFYFSLLLLWMVIVLAGFAVLRGRAFKLLNGIKDAMLIAFSTSTSEAAYPRILMELERFGCKNKIVSFVLPLGYSFNLDGSMMYMTFASLFLAQCYHVPLTLSQQFSMLLTLMLTSKGVAGVPRAALVVVAGTIAIYNIPEAGLALLLAIDPLLDMGRSATNVLGNAMATAVVSKWEGELGDEQISEQIQA